ncbi:MAG: hypothetical protein KDD44_10710 [Bdellovibrionales bacterium]|nr:hypothetical protein [Bdellovibrionales bacterium]
MEQRLFRALAFALLLIIPAAASAQCPPAGLQLTNVVGWHDGSSSSSLFGNRQYEQLEYDEVTYIPVFGLCLPVPTGNAYWVLYEKSACSALLYGRVIPAALPSNRSLPTGCAGTIYTAEYRDINNQSFGLPANGDGIFRVECTANLGGGNGHFTFDARLQTFSAISSDWVLEGQRVGSTPQYTTCSPF